jgi:hypothetical protein
VVLVLVGVPPVALLPVTLPVLLVGVPLAFDAPFEVCAGDELQPQNNPTISNASAKRVVLCFIEKLPLILCLVCEALVLASDVHHDSWVVPKSFVTKSDVSAC